MPENNDRLLRAMVQVNPVLAGRCLHEGKADVGLDTRQTVITRLLATISDPKVALRVRVAAGEVLGYLGDPRLGELVTIPAGKFLIGDDEDDDAKPQHEVFLPEYQIGKLPVTNAEFTEFVEAGGYHEKRWWTEAGWKGKEHDICPRPIWWDDARFNKPNHPVMGVSWFASLAYCNWQAAETGQSYRLPSEAEWEKAARGTDGRRYPWGEEFEPERLNSFEGDQAVRSPTPVGIYPTGASPYGCLDMAGNVWEWTSSLLEWYFGSLRMGFNRIPVRRINLNRVLWLYYKIKKAFDYPYDSGDGREVLERGDQFIRVLRGGSWNYDRNFARCDYRSHFNSLLGGPHYGFRVVISPNSAL